MFLAINVHVFQIFIYELAVRLYTPGSFSLNNGRLLLLEDMLGIT